MEKIAIIMTVRNRKDVTKKGIESIIKANKNKHDLYFYITDDGSTDGTDKMLEEIKEKNKKYTFIITKADGNQYWAGGMRISYGKALENDNIDYYLWVNDDVEFFEDFLDTLKKDYQYLATENQDFILSGCVKDKVTNKTTYGGNKLEIKYKCYYKVEIIHPNGKTQICNLINGNCVLISKNIAKQNGNIDQRFTHGFGDWMYGIKFIKNNGKCYVTSDYVGYCNANSIKGTCSDRSLGIIKRIKLLHSIKCCPPKEFKIYLKEILGNAWIMGFINKYIKIVVTSTEYRLKHLFRKRNILYNAEKKE